jgi:hypothetical protein
MPRPRTIRPTVAALCLSGFCLMSVFAAGWAEMQRQQILYSYP